MSKVNKAVRDEYRLFQDFAFGKKIVKSNRILLKEKRTNARWLTGRSGVDHVTGHQGIQLIVEQSKVERKYGIKLQRTALKEEPFIRFDSDGPAHRNADPSIPLVKQSISTPHFNWYDSSGRPIAYKTEALQRPGDARAIAEDINFGLSHFCEETNMSLIDNTYPEVLHREPELDFAEPVRSFAGVKFE